MEAIDGCFALDDMVPEYCYHFIFVHHLNRNVVTFAPLNEEYKCVIHTLTTKVGEMCEVSCVINNNVMKLKNLQFRCPIERD